LDKFYLLARRYVAASFKFLHKQNWSDEYINQYTEMLTAGPLQLPPKSEIANDSPKNPKIPNSIRYHITDIYLDELDKVQPFESADEEFASTVEKLIAPFEKLGEEGLDKTAKTKARELLDDPRLHAGGDSEDEDEDEDEEDEDEEDEEMDEEESEDE